MTFYPSKFYLSKPVQARNGCLASGYDAYTGKVWLKPASEPTKPQSIDVRSCLDHRIAIVDLLTLLAFGRCLGARRKS
jgi:hypothetical protein